MHKRVRSVLGGACLALVLAMSGSGVALAAEESGGPRLAVQKNTLFPFRFDLETVDATGAQPSHVAGGGFGKRPLPEEFTSPSWAPDGSMMVFVGRAGRGSEGPRGARLYVSSPDGSNLRSLQGTHGADEPKFSPDGRTIFFARYRHRPRGNRQGKREFVARGVSIWSVQLGGKSPKRITPSRNGLWMFPASVSPDGRTLLASRAAKGGSWNAVKLLLGTRKTELFMRNAADPVYSPDGSRVAFVRYRRLGSRSPAEWTSDLFTVRSGGGGLRRITRSSGIDYSQSWDPSGQRLAFIRYLPERLEPDHLGYGSAVLQVNADGTCLKPVLGRDPDTAFFGVAWQPGAGREAGRIAC